MNEFISIEKPEIRKNENNALVIMYGAFVLLGIMIFISDWKTGIFSVVSNILIGLLFRKMLLKWNFKILIIISLVFIVLICLFFEVEIFIYLLIMFLLSPILYLLLFPISDWRGIFLNKNIKESSEVFFINTSVLKCISVQVPSRRYALNHFDYIKTLYIKDIKSIYFKKNKIEIAYKNSIHIPMELNQNDRESIRKFVQLNLPNLYNNQSVLENRKNENKKVTHYLLPLIVLMMILGVVIATFGENGRNKPITYTCIVLMIILYICAYRKWKTDEKEDLKNE